MDMIAPDEPCPCQSGLLYGECHQAVREAPPEAALDVGRQDYAERWRGNAESYEAQGVYGRLAEHLSSFGAATKVIDVGCGRGEGVAAMVKAAGARGHLFVGLDENPECLTAAARRLGVSAPAVRLRRIDLGDRRYDLEIIAGKLPAPGRVVLAQTDLLRPDLELDQLLFAASPYDAVTQWFSGIHPAREHDRIWRDMDISSDRVHRMATDLAALEYATNVVRDGGVFHVVTRVAGDDPSRLLDVAKEEMLAFAAHGPALLEDLILIPYEEPVIGRRIGVGASGASNERKFAASAIFRMDRASYV